MRYAYQFVAEHSGSNPGHFGARQVTGEHSLQKLRSSRGHLRTKSVYMKRFSFVAIGLIALAATSTIAVPNPNTEKVPAFPGILANARYVYVASYDGDQFNPNLLPEDQAAISAVQNAIQEWGKLIVVYRPSEADIIILVTSRPSEDLLAVYDARPWPTGNFLWRVMGRNGLQSGETPLVSQFEKGFESVQRHR
jgi:hypothetical protein